MVVEVSSKKDRENAVTGIKEGFGDSYKFEGANMLISKLIVVVISSDMSKYDIISAIWEKKMNKIINWLNGVKR